MGRKIILTVMLMLCAASYAQQPAAPDAGKQYSVQGMVIRPGGYTLARPTTVLEALVDAGGFKDFANTKDIVILRGEKRISFNYSAVIRGRSREQNIRLEDGDIIIVK